MKKIIYVLFFLLTIQNNQSFAASTSKQGCFGRFRKFIISELNSRIIRPLADCNEQIANRILIEGIRYRLQSEIKRGLDMGANLNFKDVSFNGNTPLITAINVSNVAVIPILLKAGANPSIINFSGRSFLSIIYSPNINDYSGFAVFRKAYEDFLKQNNQNIDNLIKATEANDLKTILEILKKEPYLINCENNLGETVLSSAILQGNFELIKQLFENREIPEKPNLRVHGFKKNRILVGEEKNHIFFGIKNPVEYAKKLGRPIQDPQKKVFREIACYLEIVRDIQMAHVTPLYSNYQLFH